MSSKFALCIKLDQFSHSLAKNFIRNKVIFVFLIYKAFLQSVCKPVKFVLVFRHSDVNSTYYVKGIGL